MKIIKYADNIEILKTKRWFSVVVVNLVIVVQFIWLFANFSKIKFNNIWGAFFLIFLILFYLYISYRLIWNFINDITIHIVRSEHGKFFINKNSYDRSNCSLLVTEYRGKFLGSAYSIFLINNIDNSKVPLVIKGDEIQMKETSAMISEFVNIEIKQSARWQLNM